MKKAIYALSADPITYGHINVILRALEMFDHVIVAIGNNPSKKYMLDKDERLSIVESVFEKYSNISVKHFEGALVDFSYLCDANIIVRGLRNSADFQYEQELAAINKSLKPNLETCLIIAEPDQTHVSSSSSKAIVKEYFPSSEYLPFASKKALELKMNEQVYVGITGLMGTGKSFIAEELSKTSENIHNLDLDLLCHEIYNEEDSTFEHTRALILKEFGTLERREIGKIVFNDDKKLEKLNDIFREPLKILIRKHCRNLKGVILINGATIVAENYLDFVNNTVIVVHAENGVRYERCSKGRNIDSNILIERDKKMISFDEQTKIINDKIKKDSYGKLVVLENNTFLKIDNQETSILEVSKWLLSLRQI